MNKKLKTLIICIVAAGVVIAASGTILVSQAAQETPKNRKIVVFNDNEILNESARNALLKKFGAVSIKKLPLVNGMAVLLPPKAEKALAQQVGVLRIDNDDVVFALGKPVCGDGTIEGGEKCGEPGLPECPDGYVCENCKCIAPEESTPQSDEEMAWGVNRIDADHVWAETWDQTTLPVTKADANTGQGIKVAIIDSGIDLDHPDLRVAGGYNAINFRKSYNDDFRHGTHVAGIVAALDNEIGVIGTAPNVELYAVKVLNRRGIGFASDIIDGLQWCIDKKIQVANMSIGSSGSSTSYHDAIIAASDAGITIVAAAGNYGLTDGKIVWPARWPETIAVSATDDYDNLAYFPGWWGSSYGEEVDLAAPGALINSTWNDGYYHLGSGTSMATPHVTGVVALVLNDPKLKCDYDSSGACSPSEVLQRLSDTAEWLPGLDVYQQGCGLVDAYAAVNQ